jgi:DNA-binding NarL/FixJ family response regulator
VAEWERHDRETFAMVVQAMGAEHCPLTEREVVVAWLRCVEALPQAVVAEQLGVGLKTVEAHQRNIADKLGRDWRARLTAMYQYQLGLKDGLLMGEMG